MRFWAVLSIALFLVTVSAMASGQMVQTRSIPFSVQSPNVTQAETSYPNVMIQGGDTTSINAGGCVQTGGKGDTTKNYVNPDPPNSKYGTVQFPGMSFPQPIRDCVSKFYTIPEGTPPAPLVLGYVDDTYGNNGYYAMDDGTNNQCKHQARTKPGCPGRLSERSPIE